MKIEFDDECMIQMEIKKFMEPVNRLEKLVSSAGPGWAAAAMQELKAVSNGTYSLTQLLKKTAGVGLVLKEEAVSEEFDKPSPKRRRRMDADLETWIPISKNDEGTELIPDDGFIWRKYGQKNIRGSSHPRMYYRCTHKNKNDGGCPAIKTVQKDDEDPSVYQVRYKNAHKCRFQSGPCLSYSGSSLTFQPTGLNPLQEASLMTIAQEFKLQRLSEPVNSCSSEFSYLDSIKGHILSPSESTCHSAPSVMFDDASSSSYLDMTLPNPWDVELEELLSFCELNFPPVKL